MSKEKVRRFRKESEFIVIDQDSELAGLAKFESDYFGDYKIYTRLTNLMHIVVDTKQKLVTVPHVGTSAFYEPLKTEEDLDSTRLHIQAIKQAPYSDVIEFSFKNQDSREYMQEKLLESHNKAKAHNKITTTEQG